MTSPPMSRAPAGSASSHASTATSARQLRGWRPCSRPAREHDRAVAVAGRLELALAHAVALGDDLAAQMQAVARPHLVAEADPVAEHVLAPEPLGDHRAEDRGLQLAHGEHTRLAGGARERLVVVHRVEVARGAGEAHDLRPRDRLGGPVHSSITVSVWTTASSPSARCRRVSSVMKVIPFLDSTALTTRAPRSRSPIAIGAW